MSPLASGARERVAAAMPGLYPRAPKRNVIVAICYGLAVLFGWASAHVVLSLLG